MAIWVSSDDLGGTRETRQYAQKVAFVPSVKTTMKKVVLRAWASSFICGHIL